MKALHFVVTSVAMAFVATLSAQASLPPVPVEPTTTHVRIGTVPVEPVPTASPVTARPLAPTWVGAPDKIIIEPTLDFSRAWRAVGLHGNPNRQFVMLFGVERVVSRPLPGIEIGLEPLAVLRFGRLDMFGDAWFAVDDQLPDVPGLLFQALLWPVDGADPLPNEASELLEVPLRPFDTTPPDGLPEQTIWVLVRSPGVYATAELASESSRPPLLHACLDVLVPSSGYVLRQDAVLHAGRFTRVLMTLERPSDDELVMERLEQIQTSVELGFWVGKVEVLIRDRQRQPPVYDPVKARPILKGVNG